MIERADETFDEMDKSGKHSFVAKKVYKLIPSWAKAFISEVKIDNWIHQYVHQLRQKQKAKFHKISAHDNGFICSFIRGVDRRNTYLYKKEKEKLKEIV